MGNDKFTAPEPPPMGFASAPPPLGFPQPSYPQPGLSWASPHSQQPGYSGYPPPQQQGFPSQQGYPPQQGGYLPQQEYPPHQGYNPQQSYPPQYYGSSTGYGGPPPPPPSYPSQQTVNVTVNGGWYSRNQKNKPQSNAVGGAALIFVSGGMNIAWSIGFHGTLFYTTTKHNFLAWFIGGIIGAVLSCFLTNKVAKKHVLIFSSTLVMIGGIVIASTRNNGSASLAGSYLDGIANGLVFAPFLALAGEVSVPYMRGLITASIEQMCFGLGIFVQIVYISAWTYEAYPLKNSFSPENMRGVLSAVYGLLALLIGSLLCIESPVIMLAKKNDEQGAIDALRRLQRPYTVTNETFEQLAEHKRYLAHNKDLSMGQSICQAIPTFIRLVILRGMNVLSINQLMYLTLVYSYSNGYGLSDSWAWLCGFGICRWMGNFIATFSMESAGRKKPTILGLLVCGVLAFVIAGQYNIYRYEYNIGNAIMTLVFEFFAGIAFTSTSPYLSEAYPLGVKQHFIAFTFVAEMLVFIIIRMIDWGTTVGAEYMYAVGALYVFGFVFVILCLPETRRTNLREAQEKFSRFFNMGF
ncbi:solute carrier family 2, facilitated glucose transporter member 4-like [Drosophila kikkawai]|uniref:Solute carrier family 2, facilitated glucose transporter member 4-like n=1 Tax=Drosophila kikkawai TaxID=30033 RepID=A0A6P4HQM0_DROKI